ncbi:MAG: bifunctional pyr operon transcriptional regulator/uracil phosphoribosyltransferase PyrR, partial [Planctomycetes bacterium]|nr:bifunctional pyr operon transcriptional regulator/uracil phosphoribosyltransferase PyrR [Planctomycetota bacterium]
MATKLYNSDWLAETMQRLSDEILTDRHPGTGLAIIGLQTRGVILAERLGKVIQSKGTDIEVGSIDATMHRDDLHTGAGLKPIQATEINFDLNDKAVVLVDDVMCTGRTIRAALDALFAYGRPSCIRLLVMLDRGGRELPIQPDFTGAQIDVPKGGFVRL